MQVTCCQLNDLLNLVETDTIFSILLNWLSIDLLKCINQLKFIKNNKQ